LTTGAIALAAVPWLLAIAGWLFASREANRRETRKELRADLADIEARTGKLVESAKAYCSHPAHSVEQALAHAQVLSTMHAILSGAERYLGVLRPDGCPHKRDASQRLTEFYELGTGDALTTAASADNAGREMYFLELNAAALRLVGALTMAFRAKYPAR